MVYNKNVIEKTVCKVYILKYKDDDSGSEVDMDYILVEQTDIAIPEEDVAISDAESGSDARTDSDSDSDDADTDPRDTEEEEVLGSSEGE